jgi:predicted ATPase with chaperone activity
MLLPVGHAGPPGAGKPKLARRLATILADMTLAEVLDTTRIPRVAELTGRRTAVVAGRPFRAPHHTITDVGLIGGGQVPTPGEVSLAHHGVLFLEALPGCRRHGLEGLGQPLEEGVTWIQSPARPQPDCTGGASRADGRYEQLTQGSFFAGLGGPHRRSRRAMHV